jgi:hypothetical protein
LPAELRKFSLLLAFSNRREKGEEATDSAEVGLLPLSLFFAKQGVFGLL